MARSKNLKVKIRFDQYSNDVYRKRERRRSLEDGKSMRRHPEIRPC